MGTTADLLAPQAAPHSHEQLHGQGTADARHSGADGYLHSSSTPSSNTPNDQGGRDWHALQDAHSGRPLKVANGEPRLCEVFYFHTDQVGLPEELTNSQGKLCWQASFKTWGNTVKEEWEVQTPSGQKVNVLDEGARPSTEQNLRFQGQYLDRDTGLHYNTFRFYDPDIGRFISPDPIGLEGGINLGSYSPNPISWIDPWGWAGNPAKSTHITYVGTKNGKPYVGYASKPGLGHSAQDVLDYRYPNKDHFDKAPKPIYKGDGMAGKRTARGLEQRTFEKYEGLGKNGRRADGSVWSKENARTSNLQNPVGENNPNRKSYLRHADRHNSGKKGC